MISFQLIKPKLEFACKFLFLGQNILHLLTDMRVTYLSSLRHPCLWAEAPGHLSTDHPCHHDLRTTNILPILQDEITVPFPFYHPQTCLSALSVCWRGCLQIGTFKLVHLGTPPPWPRSNLFSGDPHPMTCSTLLTM